MKKYNVCILGASGVVGRTFLEVLEEVNFPVGELKLLASSRSAGTVLQFKGKDYVVEEVNEHSFDGFDIGLFSPGACVSKIYAPIAQKAGCVVIDNTSAFRELKEIPLVVPEVNSDDIALNNGIIANPNCSTIQSVIPLKALRDRFGLKKVCYTTYQAVAGSGIKGINDLERTRKGLDPEFYPYNISSTCIPEIDIPMENGYTKEEMKMVNETRKILHLNDLPVSATCVRVPILRSHAVSMSIILDKKFTLDEVRECLMSQEGVVLVDDLPNHLYPTQIMSTGNNMVYVGRLRYDLANENGLLLYCTADNIRRGAASNAVFIAQKLIMK